MALQRGLFAAAISGTALLLPSAAWAAYDQTLILEGPGGAAIESTQLSFVTDSGATVPVTYYDEDDEDFDGVFVIEFAGDRSEGGTLTFPGRDGRPQTVAIPAAAGGKAVTVNVATGQVGISALPFSPLRLAIPDYLLKPFIEGDVGWTRTDVPETTFGVGDIGGSEYPLLGTQTRYNFATYGGSFGAPLGKVLLTGSYYTGGSDGQTSTTVASGGSPRGWVFIADSSELGTGVGLGSLELGIDSFTNYDFDYGKVRLALPLSFESGKDVFQPSLSLAYGEYDVSQFASYTVPAYPNQVYSDVEEHYQLDRWGIGLGATYYHPFCDKFFVGLGGELTVNFNHRKFDAMQDVTVFATSDTIAVQDSWKDTSIGLAGELSGTYLFTPDIGLSVFGRVSYDDDFGQIVNPLSGNDVLAGDEAGIGKADVTTLSAGVRLAFKF